MSQYDTVVQHSDSENENDSQDYSDSIADSIIQPYYDRIEEFKLAQIAFANELIEEINIENSIRTYEWI
eukprot:TRINITY_DN1112_c0_g1_i1.p1 TRINITY_DN1112_c0_g1~~TRINITY_DN1112_c0_g1_i1.p1  ORF type:complete len:69 (+),score=20.79 TRINITY_DN1112_c0_g1_i1:35-241(+)